MDSEECPAHQSEVPASLSTVLGESSPHSAKG
jgi:hypothetical protein